MVKIKEGYVISPRQRAEYERMDALPRKKYGRVDYYFKPQTKYPPRVYVFMHAEIWCDRNRRPMGLFYALPFLSREMNDEEIEYHHFDHRLCYHQYESWEKLIYAEEQEAFELDKTSPGKGAQFLTDLKSFRTQYRLNGVVKDDLPVPDEPDNDESLYLKDLICNGNQLKAREIAELMNKEQEGEKRLSVLILLRELYKNSFREEKDKIEIDRKMIDRKVWLSQERTRKNFVRRIFKSNKLFALAEISVRYPGYNENMLLCDLIKRSPSIRQAKPKPVLDLRRCQLVKLVYKLTREELTEGDYDKICNRIAMLQHAHKYRLPIPLSVTINKETRVYSFHWRTRESVVKSFVNIANTRDMTHEMLENRHQEMCRSVYSY